MINPEINVKGLSKSFGSVEAVKGVSFEVEKGEIFGFLGPNGAGKTTTINMLTGLARPDGGSIELGGLDCTSDRKPVQHLIGVVPDESSLYPELTGFENLCFCGALYGMRKKERIARAKELLDTVGLADAAKRRFGGYSKGMGRRLIIAAGVIHKPSVLFLDEPTTGIDVVSARTIRSMIRALNENGTTVFLTTHYLEEAERLCDRVAFIRSGRIVLTDTMEGLLKKDRKGEAILLRFDGEGNASAESILRSAFPAVSFEPSGRGAVTARSETYLSVGAMVRTLEDGGFEVLEARRIASTLEDVFLQVAEMEDER